MCLESYGCGLATTRRRETRLNHVDVGRTDSVTRFGAVADLGLVPGRRSGPERAPAVARRPASTIGRVSRLEAAAVQGAILRDVGFHVVEWLREGT